MAGMNTISTPNISSIETLQLENIQLKEKLAWYEEQFRLYKHQQYSASSERSDEQGQLFNEPEELTEEPAPEEPETQKIPAHERKKPARKRYRKTCHGKWLYSTLTTQRRPAPAAISP